jgi:aspartyl-tRNA(Asn)/glutamyl-tRNA(Gln) amidotransferase subunit A
MTMLGSFLDTPAIAMPSGTDTDGLPTSVQIMRAQGDDDALLRIATALEAMVL